MSPKTTLVPVTLLLASLSAADIRYNVQPELPGRTIRVSVVAENPGKTPEFRIPAWTPGFYYIQDYQKKISDVVATDPTGRRLALSKTNDRSWRVANPSGANVTLSYRVLGDDPGLGFFGVSVHPHTAFINGPAAFMYLEGEQEQDTKLSFRLPKGWEVATAMDHQGDIYTAGDYDELVDHPIQLGIFERRKFDVLGVPFEAVYVSPSRQYRANLAAETRKLQKISEPAMKMFGSAPFKRYLYVIHLATGNFAGGLEHRASNVMAIGNDTQLYTDDLASHEFFHAWNVKQIRPKVLGPFDYTKQVQTRNLWFAEGVTDYYAKLHTYQAGVWDLKQMLSNFGHELRTLQMGRNRLKLTLEDASMGAWENGGMGTGDLSYYNKGLVAGLVLDAAIRTNTGGQKSLDDVMRALYERNRLPKPGYDEDELRTVINTVAGTDLTALYTQIVRSTDELPYGELRGIGLRYRRPDDKVLDLGFSTVGNRVEAVMTAAGAGLVKGDVIVKVNGEELRPGSLQSLDPNRAFELEVRRGGETKSLRLQPGVSTSHSYALEFDPLASAESAKLRQDWLKGEPRPAQFLGVR